METPINYEVGGLRVKCLQGISSVSGHQEMSGNPHQRTKSLKQSGTPETQWKGLKRSGVGVPHARRRWLSYELPTTIFLLSPFTFQLSATIYHLQLSGLCDCPEAIRTNN